MDRSINLPLGRSDFGGRSRLQVCRRFSAISALFRRPRRFPLSSWSMTHDLLGDVVAPQVGGV
jgi:hypothetical protein